MEQEKIKTVESPTNMLESLKRGEIAFAPNLQRTSFEGTRFRLSNLSTKKYKFNKVINTNYFQIQRTR